MRTGEEEHVHCHIETIELRRILMRQERGEIEKAKRRNGSKSCHVRIVFSGNAALMDTDLQIGRGIQHRKAWRIQASISGLGHRRAVVFVGLVG